jgi:hypothetical protein
MEREQRGSEDTREDYISGDLLLKISIDARVKGRSQHPYVLWGISSTLTLATQYK